mgnify:CR=1 FL=1
MLRPISSDKSIAESSASSVSVRFSEDIQDTRQTWLGKRGRINKTTYRLQRRKDQEADREQEKDRLRCHYRIKHFFFS